MLKYKDKEAQKKNEGQGIYLQLTWIHQGQTTLDQPKCPPVAKDCGLDAAPPPTGVWFGW